MLCIETSTYLGSLQKFEGDAGEFKGALGSRHPIISSPEVALEDAIGFPGKIPNFEPCSLSQPELVMT